MHKNRNNWQIQHQLHSDFQQERCQEKAACWICFTAHIVSWQTTDNLETFLAGIGSSIKILSPLRQLQVKNKIYGIISQLELEQLIEDAGRQNENNRERLFRGLLLKDYLQIVSTIVIILYSRRFHILSCTTHSFKRKHELESTQ